METAFPIRKMHVPISRAGSRTIPKRAAVPLLLHQNETRPLGCPPVRDHDGVLDKDDACPDDPGMKTDDPTTNGCPDRDKDGIIDKVDACPDVAGLKTSDPKTNGCPDPDRDKDGIANEQDACPDEPGKPDPDPK